MEAIVTLKLRKIRESTCMSQKSAAELIGVTRKTFISWELEQRKPSNMCKKEIIKIFGEQALEREE